MIYYCNISINHRCMIYSCSTRCERRWTAEWTCSTSSHTTRSSPSSESIVLIPLRLVSTKLSKILVHQSTIVFLFKIFIQTWIYLQVSSPFTSLRALLPVNQLLFVCSNLVQFLLISQTQINLQWIVFSPIS